ncbi:MAG: SDR family NAD(P)-dependent oxidoreductase [Planctomycetota bacterium]|jgi:short-subunit dehydrogenase|nr:SDR family NAD(P)-dependent oxidoreductase [Planctomycetota bacterium]
MVKRKIQSSRVVVTGASSGIGFELAKQLLQGGCQVLATARRQEKLEQLFDFRGEPGQLEIVAGDLVDPVTRSRIIQTAEAKFGGLEMLINNAGVSSLGRFTESNESCLRQVMEVNFFAPVELIRLAIPILQQGIKPIIVNISSVLGHRAVPEKSEYCASKFALHGFSDALRAEIASGVDVLLVSPATTQSEFFDNVVENHSERDWTPRKAMLPEVVARKTIQAIKAGKDEVILTLGGKGIVLLDRLAPVVANKVVQKFG